MNEETLHLLAEIVPKDYESEDDTGLDDWLQARERLNQEGVFPWPFRRPYRVLGEAHLPQEKLPPPLRKKGYTTTATTATTANPVRDGISPCGGCSPQPPQTTATTAKQLVKKVSAKK